MKTHLLIIFVLFPLFISCQKPDDNSSEQKFVFAKGADISWVTEMEKAGKKFYNNKGEQRECTALMKELGLDAIRLRVWVNPLEHGNYCNKEDVLIKAKRAAALKMRIMIDFHYSDWWADPGQQNKPAAWKNLNLEELKTALAQHTTDILNALKAENITPEWVQVGNENRSGMLWDTNPAVSGATYDVTKDGVVYAKNENNFAEFIKTSYDAAKSVFPNTKVIVHIDNGYDNGLYRWFFDELKKRGAKWDVIGMSLYPYWAKDKYDSWQKVNEDCLANIDDMIERYGSEIMICEVGHEWNKAEEAKEFLTDLILKTKSVPDNKVLGVFYWEPECYNWGYQLGAFDQNGKPTVAMDAFKN
jgi:arabinogalactan endo-1,4-beta-galactosidase